MKRLLSLALVILFIMPGCMTTSGSIGNQESYFDKEQRFSFSSAPNEADVLGYLELGPEKAPLVVIDVIYSITSNESVNYCGSTSITSCVILPDVSRGTIATKAGEMIIQDDQLPTCYDDCEIRIEVYYFGKLTAIFYGINF